MRNFFINAYHFALNKPWGQCIKSIDLYSNLFKVINQAGILLNWLGAFVTAILAC